MRSQVQCINEPPPKTWADYRRGCLGTFRGGHQKPETSRAFVHGMETVFSLLEAEFPPAEQCKASPELLEACKKLVAGAKDVVYSPNKRRQFWGAPVKLWQTLEAIIARAEPEENDAQA